MKNELLNNLSPEQIKNLAGLDLSLVQRHFENPTYSRAEIITSDVRVDQIIKGIKKYSGPLVPTEWTPAQLVRHAFEEVVDLEHYLTALLELIEGESLDPALKNEMEYIKLCKRVFKEGILKGDRTGTGTLSVFGHQMRFDLSKGHFPLLTTKKINFKKVLGELLAFVAGETNAEVIAEEFGFKMWKKWAKDERGDLGPIYGSQWRSWPTLKIDPKSLEDGKGKVKLLGIDQLNQVIGEINSNPNSRRLIVSAWNVAQIDDMALPPCHLLFQFYVAEGRLSLQLYQRSADIFLGVPYNIASYSILLLMVAHLTGLKPGEFIHTLGDAHIYLNHMDQIGEQIEREIKAPPVLNIVNPIMSIDDFWFNDFELIGYNPHPALKGEVSI